MEGKRAGENGKYSGEGSGRDRYTGLGKKRLMALNSGFLKPC